MATHDWDSGYKVSSPMSEQNPPPAPSWSKAIISNVTEVKLKKQDIGYRFNLTVIETDGREITYRGCLTGANRSHGQWVMPPRGYKGAEVVAWSSIMQSIVLQGLKDNGLAVETVETATGFQASIPVEIVL